MENTYHAADNSNWGVVLANLINAGAQVGTAVLAPDVNKADAKQQALNTPGGTASAASFGRNRPPWLIIAGAIIAAGLGLLLLFRSK